jgi:alpha-ribazole phosphatase
MRTIIFVRHGQSHSNVGGVTMEHHAIPLTDVGRNQAELLSLMLPELPADVLVSPFLRAQDTAAPYCTRYSVKRRTLDVLREFETIDPELLKGMSGDERRPIVDAYWAESLPDKRMGERAETFREFVDRVTRFKALELPVLNDCTVVVGHGMWTAMLIWQLLGFSADDSYAMKAFRRFQLGFPMPNGAVYHLTEVHPSQWSVTAGESVMRQIVALAR